MKFQKVLAEFAEDDSPEHPTFLRYKMLKKLLKVASEQQAAARNKEGGSKALSAPPIDFDDAKLRMTLSEKEFVETLQEDVKNINTYFMEQEEEAVIKLQDLVDRRAALGSGAGKDADIKALHAAFINLHGELILLFHYSTVNYAGILKILKKHDKLLGCSSNERKKETLRNLLQQPFTSTESISRLVRSAEDEIRSLAGNTAAVPDAPRKTDPGASVLGKRPESGLVPQTAEEARLLKRTRAALEMLEHLQSNAHTPSTLLPPAAAVPQNMDRPKEKKHE